MKFPNYGGKSQEISVRLAKARLDAIERDQLKENRAELIGNVHFMEQMTSSVATKTYGKYVSGATGTTSAIDEDTNAAVVARTNLEDPFGNGSPVVNPLGIGSSHVALPLFDYEGRTAFYHGYYLVLNDFRRNLSWGLFEPNISHTKLPFGMRSFEMNVPGNSGFDKDAFIYYSSNAVFNISGNNTCALWFVPTAIADGAEVFTFLQWRYIDASNWYAVVIGNADNFIQVHVREGGTTTKREVNTEDVFNAPSNGWNLVVWTYNATTNALTIRVNNEADNATPTETLTVPYTTDQNMYLGNIPLSNTKRFEGYLGPFIMWNTVLTGTQQTNLWTHGTIV